MIKLTIIVIAIIIIIVRKVISAKNNMQDENMFSKAKQDPAYAENLIDNVRLFYHKTDYTDFDMQQFREQLRQRKFEKYKVVDSIESGRKLLLFTNRVHEDWGTKWNGHAGEVKKEQYDFFVVDHDAENKKLFVYGDNYQ